MKPKLYRPDCHHAERYYHAQGVQAAKPRHLGFMSFPILDFLWGQLWDDVALSCVLAMRPGTIRVTPGECTTDAQMWRVTVYVDPEDRRTITRIDQEIEIPLFGDERNGHDFHVMLHKRGVNLNYYLADKE